MTTVTQQHVYVRGISFGMRGCSCTCSPCDCDPCSCDDSRRPNYPRWRVSGYIIETGEIQKQDVSGLLLLSLSQPIREGENDAWQEVILVDERATLDQSTLLLTLFEEQLQSMPTEVLPQTHGQRSVFRLPIEYSGDEHDPVLRVSFQPEHALLVREGVNNQETPLRALEYEGPTALRGRFDLRR